MGEATRTERGSDESRADVRRRLYVFAAVLIAVLLITLAIYALL